MIGGLQNLAVLLAVVAAVAYLATRLSAVLSHTRFHGCRTGCRGCSLAAEVRVRPSAGAFAEAATESGDRHPSC